MKSSNSQHIGLGPCVSVIIYNAENHVGAMTHYDTPNGLEDSLGHILGPLNSFSGNFDVYLVGGSADPVSKKLVDAIKARLEQNYASDRYSIKDTELYVSESQSVGLNTQNGELFSYDPKNNSNSKDIFGVQGAALGRVMFGTPLLKLFIINNLRNSLNERQKSLYQYNT